MKLRLFIAIPIEKSLADKLDSWNQQNSSPKLRLTKKENLHITVLFLGYVEEENLVEIKNKLLEISRSTKNFDLSIEQNNLAPPQGTKRMVWTYFQESREFKELADKVYQALGKYSREKVHREALPHITLARSKETLKKEDSISDTGNFRGEVIKINSLILFRSQPSKSGSKYSFLAGLLLKD